ncbi:hypothetical protein DENSPDRAFT_494552 [Dentipellis sp. KUC8613]|nr:hypothetical protein DENSPDRAFT_494552 [Dentipellis sp. KUC8613]
MLLDSTEQQSIPSPEPLLVPQEPIAVNKASGTRYGLRGAPDRVEFRRSDGSDEGVALSFLLDRKFDGLADAETLVLAAHGSKITFHVNWPTYQPWQNALDTRSWTKAREPRDLIDRRELGHRIALRMQKFIKEAVQVDSLASQWTVGNSGIGLDRIVLRSLFQVTQGGWQAELCVVGKTLDN